MTAHLRLKIAVDLAMTVALMLLMPYELIGQSAHEWIGMVMLVLFIGHHILNQSCKRLLDRPARLANSSCSCRADLYAGFHG